MVAFYDDEGWTGTTTYTVSNAYIRGHSRKSLLASRQHSCYRVSLAGIKDSSFIRDQQGTGYISVAALSALGSRDLGSRDLGSRDLGSRDLGSRDRRTLVYDEASIKDDLHRLSTMLILAAVNTGAKLEVRDQLHRDKPWLSMNRKAKKGKQRAW